MSMNHAKEIVIVNLSIDIMNKSKDKLLEHFLRPRNVGTIEDADGYSSVENPINGYRTDIYIKIQDGKIEDIKFKTIGCTATIASDSALTEIINGKKIEELIIKNISFENLLKSINEELGKVPDKNWHCPPTAILAFFTAINNYYKKIGDKGKISQTEELINIVNKYFEDTLTKL